MSEATEQDRERPIAVVTGGSRGIGHAIAQSLASDGWRVAVVGRDPETASVAAQGLPGEGHQGFACDVSDAQAVQELVVAVTSQMGPIAALVNNAGVTRDNILLRMKDEEWDDVMRINLKGAFNMTRACARGMMKARSGVIINVSSVIGLIGNAGQANYAASKAGLIGFTKSVAKELASRGVRCNAVAPGFIETDMTAALADDQVDQLLTAIPLGRLGKPEDVAGVVRFLVGDEARYITGQVLSVAGGMVM